MATTVEPSKIVTTPTVVEETHPRRLLYLDNLKVVLIAGVIAAHAAMTYGAIGDWVYMEKSPGSLMPAIVSMIGQIGWLFGVGLFFLVAGLLTPGPLRRKGAGQFLRDRLLRLGIPLLVYVLIIMPPVRYAAATAMGLHESFWTYLTTRMWVLDPGPWIMNMGPMWFVAFLLVFTLCYVAWRQIRPYRPGNPGSLRPLTLIKLAIFIALGSAALRLVWPFDPRQVLDLHVGLWVQYPAMFWFGIYCAERGWLTSLPDRLWHWCGYMAAAAAAAVPVLFLASGTLQWQRTALLGGWPWPDLILAGIEGIIAVSASLWVLDYFRRYHDRQRSLGQNMSRSAYAAFMIQAPVLVGIAIALRPLPLPPEAKLLILAPTAVILSFGAAWLLISWVPITRRVL